MTWRLLFAVAVIVLLGAAPAEAKRLRTYVACGVADSTYRPPPSHLMPGR